MLRVGTVDKGKPQTGIRRIRLPEPLIPAKVRQAGIDAHPGPGDNYKDFRIPDHLCGTLQHGSSPFPVQPGITPSRSSF